MTGLTKVKHFPGRPREEEDFCWAEQAECVKSQLRESLHKVQVIKDKEPGGVAEKRKGTHKKELGREVRKTTVIN